MTAFSARNERFGGRAVLIVTGLVLLGSALFGPKTPWGYIGILPLATGALGTCPLYALLGISTCAVEPRRADGSVPDADHRS